MISKLGILFMRALAHLPLAWIRALGSLLGHVLYIIVVPRRRVVHANLALCYPQRSEAERRGLARQVFVFVAQAWLDRSWLWHSDATVTRSRVKMTGALHELDGHAPTVLFGPHFVGMDATWIALTQQVPRVSASIYTDQSNKVVDAWMLKGRSRFPAARPFTRADGVREIVSSLRKGVLLYLLPDMNFGPQESVFVPFYGVPAATVPSLSRFARLGHAKVVPVITRMTSDGYDVEVKPAWIGFPTDDPVADTALMNQHLEEYIDAMPAQYYWVHKRFKTRPSGMPPVY